MAEYRGNVFTQDASSNRYNFKLAEIIALKNGIDCPLDNSDSKKAQIVLTGTNTLKVSFFEKDEDKYKPSDSVMHKFCSDNNIQSTQVNKSGNYFTFYLSLSGSQYYYEDTDTFDIVNKALAGQIMGILNPNPYPVTPSFTS